MGKFNLSSLLNTSTQQEIGKRLTETGIPWEVQNIPLDKIRPSERNCYGIRDIDQLAASIEEVGLLHNLVVCKAEQGDQYELISGERRYQALKQLSEGGESRWKEAPCLVMKVSREMAHFQLLIANGLSRELTDYEKVMQAQEMEQSLIALKQEGHKFSGRIRENVGDVLGIKPGNVRRYESIYRHLIPEWMEQFRQDKIGVSAAYELSCMDEDSQRRALREFETQGELSANQAKELRERYQDRQPLKGQMQFGEIQESGAQCQKSGADNPGDAFLDTPSVAGPEQSPENVSESDTNRQESEEPIPAQPEKPPENVSDSDTNRQESEEPIPAQPEKPLENVSESDTIQQETEEPISAKQEQSPENVSDSDTIRQETANPIPGHPENVSESDTIQREAEETGTAIPIVTEQVFQEIRAGRCTALLLKQEGLKRGDILQVGEYESGEVIELIVTHVMSRGYVCDSSCTAEELMEEEGFTLVFFRT